MVGNSLLYKLHFKTLSAMKKTKQTPKADLEDTLGKNWEYNQLRDKQTQEMRSDASRTRLFRCAKAFLQANPQLYRINLFQLVREVCSLYLLSSYEMVVWVKFCLDKICEGTPETVFTLLSTEAKRVKAIFSPV